MKMRAKLQIESITKTAWAEELKFHGVCSGNKEDNSFAEATPSASLSMQITNKALHGQFKPGDKFYVDFTPASPQP